MVPLNLNLGIDPCKSHGMCSPVFEMLHGITILKIDIFID